MKGLIDQVFAEVLEYLIEAGYVKHEQYFADGTKIEHIEQVIAGEQAEYGDQDLEERGGNIQAKGLPGCSFQTATPFFFDLILSKTYLTRD